MKSSKRALGVLIFGAVAGVGCAARPPLEASSGAESNRAQPELTDARRRVVKLETRLAELEQEQARRDRAELLREQRRTTERLDQLIVLNTRLLEIGIQPAREQESEAPNPLPSTRSVAADAPESGSSFKEKLKALMDELRDDPSPWRGGLSLEQNQALRVLLRPERSLDSTNPWRDF